MSTAPSTASPRALRGKQQNAQSAAQPSQNHAGKQSQRKPRGNRTHNGHHKQNGAGASPSRPPLDANANANAAFTESAVTSGEEAQLPSGPRHPKKHTQSQPSIDRVFSPTRAQTALTDSETAPNNPSATPARIQGAYAGPTFHASPAPSALPIPKFLSRSVPAKTRVGPPTPPPDDSSDSTNSPSPPLASPSRAPIPVPQRHQDSPLDLLFNADKAERAKNVNGSPASNGFFNPSNATRPHHYKHDSYNSSTGVFPMELDGKPTNMQLSPPPAASPAAHRAVTDPLKVPQLKDVPQSTNGPDVMQDLFNRLSMSQKNLNNATPPRANGQAPSDPQSRHQTPSPFHDGQPVMRSASGPSTPAPAQEQPDFFYGNRNLSPLFKAAKGDTSKRNSGLRTEITADSPLVGQGMFQDFPSVTPPRPMDPNTFSRGYGGNGGEGPGGPRRGSVPFIPPHQQSPNNRRRTPGRQSYQPRPDSYPAKINMNSPAPRAGKPAGNGLPAPATKPSTSMMSFVPSSVAAKQRSSSTTPSTGTPPLNSTSSDTLALEQDLKRLLNLKMTGDAPGVW